MKIGLGTAQLGLDYGISNRSGRVTPAELSRILATARDAGVRVIDTAAAYGDAEERLGRSLGKAHPFRIVTKLPGCPPGLAPSAVATWVNDALEQSLARLRATHVYGFLVHATGDLLGPGGPDIWDAMTRARDAGRIHRIGASIYTAPQLDALLERYPLRLVQVPVSVLDQRLVRSGHLARLHDAGTEVHARSIFLQGLLLMDPEHLGHPHFDGARETLRALHAAAREAGRSPLEVATSFALSLDEVDVAVVGVARAAELAEILAGAASPLPPAWYARYAMDDPAILDPSRWPA